MENRDGVNEGGSGLGLTICSKLVKLMGGDINVKSIKDVGTTFEFTISLKCIPVDNS